VWTEITRPKYERAGQRYACDLTDAEWAVIEPHMPGAKPLGRPRGTDLRASPRPQRNATVRQWPPRCDDDCARDAHSLPATNTSTDTTKPRAQPMSRREIKAHNRRLRARGMTKLG
jgi:transposase